MNALLMINLHTPDISWSVQIYLPSVCDLVSISWPACEAPTPHSPHGASLRGHDMVMSEVGDTKTAVCTGQQGLARRGPRPA